MRVICNYMACKEWYVRTKKIGKMRHRVDSEAETEEKNKRKSEIRVRMTRAHLNRYIDTTVR